MSWWLWIAYCALCAGIFLYPSRFNLRVAQQARTRGKLMGLLSAFGAAAGIAVSFTCACLILIAYILNFGAIPEFLSWVGMSWLILTGLWTVGTVPFRLASADNDNLPASGWSATIAESLIVHLTSLRFLAFFLALLTQFAVAPNRLSMSDFIDFQVVTFATAFAALSLLVFNPMFSIGYMRKIAEKAHQNRPANKTLIAGKAVKARYRKIAA